LQKFCDDASRGIKEYLHRRMKTLATKTKDELNDAQEKLGKTPDKLAEFSAFIDNLRNITEDSERLHRCRGEIEDMHNLLYRFGKDAIDQVD